MLIRRLLILIVVSCALAATAQAKTRDTVIVTGPASGITIGPHPHGCVNVKLWFGTHDRRHHIHWLQGTAIVCFNHHTVIIREPSRIAQ